MKSRSALEAVQDLSLVLRADLANLQGNIEHDSIRQVVADVCRPTPGSEVCSAALPSCVCRFTS